MKHPDKSELELYCTDVINGNIVTSLKVKKLCSRLLAKINNPGKYHFDRKRAEHPIEFIEQFCYIPSGKLGQPFILERYEKAWIQSIFGFVDDEGNRQYREAFIVVGRKNGKTSLSAALELYMLIADGEGAAQIYNVANKFDQACLGFNAALKMMRQSRKLSGHLQKRADDIYFDKLMGFIKPLASNTGALDGLDVHMAVIDELAAMRDRDLYDLIKQGMSAREQPLLLVISTNGFVRNGVFDAQMEYAAKWLEGTIEDETFIPWIYELDDRDEWMKPECWIKANPGLGTVKKEEALKGYVQKALDDPSFKPTVMTKDFNLPENASIAWLNWEEAVNEETFDFKSMGFRYCIVGFDAADSIDLTAAQALMMRPGDDKIYELSMYWIPEDVILADLNSGKRTERDGAPYQAWISRGLMRTVPGNKVDKRVILDWMIELRDELDVYTMAVGYDPWHIDDTLKRELESFVGSKYAIPVRQGPQTLSQPMKQLKADYKINRIVDNKHPITSWCRMNVQVRSDVNGNLAPNKKMDNPANRIDGWAAELDAYIVLNNYMDDYQARIDL